MSPLTPEQEKAEEQQATAQEQPESVSTPEPQKAGVR